MMGEIISSLTESSLKSESSRASKSKSSIGLKAFSNFKIALRFKGHNAEHSGGPSGTSGGRRPRTAAICYALPLPYAITASSRPLASVRTPVSEYEPPICSKEYRPCSKYFEHSFNNGASSVSVDAKNSEQIAFWVSGFNLVKIVYRSCPRTADSVFTAFKSPSGVTSENFTKPSDALRLNSQLKA